MIKRKRALSFDPKSVLPPELTCKGADSCLYLIGLSHYECKSNVTRITFYNPRVVFLILFTKLISNLVLIAHKSSLQYHLSLGDPDYFIGTDSSVNQLVVFCNMLTIGSQVFHYINHKRGIQPTYLKLFEVLAGLVCPADLGLYNKEQTYKLVKKCRKSLKVADTVIKSMTLSTFALAMTIFSQKVTWLQFLFLSMPHSIIWAVWINYFYSILIYQSVYFYIITSYLRSKLESINTEIKDTTGNIRGTIKSMTNTFEEIIQYNDNYWSKFLFLIWVNMGSVIALLVFVVMIAGIEQLMIKILFNNYVIINSTILLFMISLCSGVYSEANRSYKLLNSYLCSHRNLMSDNLVTKLKVPITFV